MTIPEYSARYKETMRALCEEVLDCIHGLHQIDVRRQNARRHVPQKYVRSLKPQEKPGQRAIVANIRKNSSLTRFLPIRSPNTEVFGLFS